MSKGFQSEVKKLTEAFEGFKKTAEIKEMKSAANAAGDRNIDSQTNNIPKIDHNIEKGNGQKTYQERGPGTLQFTGEDAIEKPQAAKVIEDTLSNLGIDKTGYYFGDPSRGRRFTVKFKPGAGGYTQPKEAAQYVKRSFALKDDEDWKTVKFKRDPDWCPVEYSFQYDLASNQHIKEIVVEHIHKMIQDKPGGSEFKAY